MSSSSDTPLDQAPGLTPPPGLSSNFNIHNQLNDILIGTVIVCLLFTTLFIIARLIIRIRIDKTLKSEDYTSIACWVGFVTYNGIALAIGAAGAGRHQWDVSIASIIRIGLLGNVIEIVYGPTVWLAKVSVLLQYRSIFVTTRQGIVYWSIHFLVWTNFLFYLIDTFVVIFQCSPRAKIWNFLLPGTCLNARTNFVVTGAWNVFSDFMILFLPLYAIWHLKIPLKRKLGVAAVFATGSFACIASIFRLYYTVQWAKTEDATHVFLQVALWGLAELATVVLCGSVVILPKFFQLLRGTRHKPTSRYGQSAERNPYPRSKFPLPSVSKSSTPWNDSIDSACGTVGNYIPLQEARPSTKQPREATPNSDEHSAGCITKTIHIETESLSKPGHIDMV